MRELTQRIRFLVESWGAAIINYFRSSIAAPAPAPAIEAVMAAPPPQSEASPTPKPRIDPAVRKRASERRIRNAERDKISGYVDDMLTRFQELWRRRSDIGAATSELAMTRLLGCDFHIMHPDIDKIGGESDIVLDGDADDLADAVWPLDIGMIVRKEHGYFINRLVTTNPAEVRGRVRMILPRMAMMHGGHFDDDGSWWAQSIPVGLSADQWIVLDAGMQTRDGGSYIATRSTNAQLRDEINTTSRISTGLALTKRYSWHVALGLPEWPDGPRVLLATSPNGCLSFFKDREIGEGRSRRAALRHWVRQHYRDLDQSGAAFVREHLRGHTEFGWRGLAAEILVSAYDLERNELFRQQADSWRAARKHNVVKFRMKRQMQ